MSLEAEIKDLIENSKIEKLMKEKLIALGYRKENELNTLQADICRLKSEYER